MSLWAIAEGHSAARGLDLYLMGRSDLPAPLPEPVVFTYISPDIPPL